MMKLALINNLKTILCLLYFTLISFSVTAAHAQTITELQPLTFGQVALTNNSTPRSIEITSTGSINADPAYVFFTDPQRGEVVLDGYLPNTVYTITFSSPTTVYPTGIGLSNFTLGPIMTVPTVIMTDGTGSVTFNTYATLTSDGGGGTHVDDLFEGTYNMTIAP